MVGKTGVGPRMTELGIGTIVILEAWVLIMSIGGFDSPFDEWKWYFIMSIFPIILGIAIYGLLDAMRAEYKKRKAQA